MRLDRLLKDLLPEAPLSLLQKLLRTGQVRVNSGRKKGNYRLIEGEKVRIPPINLEPVFEEGAVKKCPPWVVEELGKRVLFRDDSLLILDKPAGMAVHGGTKQSWGVVDGVRELLESEAGEGESPELCHRLDRDTSGCLLFGLGKYATRALTAGFRDGTIHKEYVALVKGRPNPPKGVIDKPLMKGVVRGGERMVVPAQKGEGQEARTGYRTKKNYADVTLLNITLETGRTHQIRAHFNAIGCPLVQDQKYGDREFNRKMKKKGFTRLFLHAQKLVFNHPETKERIEIFSPLDDTMKKMLEGL
jgi:23S rRNA pseudouridine955/2504/2580 synthase